MADAAAAERLTAAGAAAVERLTAADTAAVERLTAAGAAGAERMTAADAAAEVAEAEAGRGKRATGCGERGAEEARSRFPGSSR
jgi:hypothetical protein